MLARGRFYRPKLSVFLENNSKNEQLAHRAYFSQIKEWLSKARYNINQVYMIFGSLVHALEVGTRRYHTNLYGNGALQICQNIS